MQLEHSFTVAVSVDRAWTVLTDLGQIGTHIPGAKITAGSPDQVDGSLKLKLGPMNLNYKGSVTLAERDDAEHRAVIAADGADARNGTAKAAMTARLSGTDDLTTVTLSTELELTGKPTQFGATVMEEVGARLVGQFAENLAAAIATVPPDAAETRDPVPASKSRARPASRSPKQAAPAETVAPESGAVEPTAVAATTVESTTVEPTVVETAAVEPTTVEPTVVEPTVVKTAMAVEARVVEPDSDQPVGATQDSEPAPAAAAPSPDRSTFAPLAGSPSSPHAAATFAEKARPIVAKRLAPVALAVVFAASAFRRRRNR